MLGFVMVDSRGQYRQYHEGVILGGGHTCTGNQDRHEGQNLSFYHQGMQLIDYLRPLCRARHPFHPTVTPKFKLAE